VRVAVGWNLFVHGYNKIMVGPTDAFLKGFADLGLNPPAFWYWSSFLIEMFGGLALILGLFTRLFAAAAAIEMLVIFVIYWNAGNGFGWLKRGYEYVLLWGLVCLAIALRGGGPYSLDRKLGREL
jgi:putative oxidoreductase